MNVGERIRQRRKELRMSADTLAKKIGKDRSTIFRYEKGDIENVPIDLIEPLARALHTSPGYLMGWVPEDVAKKNESLASIVHRIRDDDELLSLVEVIMQMSPSQCEMIQTLSKDKELYSMCEKIARLDAGKRQAVNSVLNAFEASEK